MSSLPRKDDREALATRIGTLLAHEEPKSTGRAEVLPEDAAIRIAATQGSRTFAKNREERAERTAALQAIRPGVRITPEGAKQKRPVSRAENVAKAKARLLALPPDQLMEIESSGTLDRLDDYKRGLYEDALAEIGDEQGRELAADTPAFTFGHLNAAELQAQLDQPAPAETDDDDTYDDWVNELAASFYEGDEEAA
jgi:hypothetical protein